MLFNSFSFLIFFIVVYGFYWLLNKDYRQQNILLFVSSYIFYGWWDVRFLFLIVLSTYIDYCTSLLIDNDKLSKNENRLASAYLIGAGFLFVTCKWNSVNWLNNDFSHILLLPTNLQGWWVTIGAILFVLFFNVIHKIASANPKLNHRKFYLFQSVIVNLLILGIFKYYNFFAESFIQLWAGLTGNTPGELTTKIILPVGISFFTFQTMSHTIDVYRKRIPATSSLLELSTYIAFFPQLVAGPIERGAHLLPQFQRKRTVTYDEFRSGIWLIFWGLFKKIVIADNVSNIVNVTFGPYDSLSITTVPTDGLQCLISVYAFAIQIYCDFSGYTDMARGTARLLGFDIMLNFNLPYIAVNPSDFWRRWHISLSSWLADYLYIPLGGNRKGHFNTHRNLALTMILGGLWHGAAWTFVIWGFFHGGILILYRLLGDRDSEMKLRLIKIIKIIGMFHLTCIGWLLFRAQNLTTIKVFIVAIFTNFHFSSQAIETFNNLLYYSWFLLLFQAIQAYSKELDPMQNWHWFIRLNVWIFIITCIFRLAPVGTSEFIYFAF